MFNQIYVELLSPWFSVAMSLYFFFFCCVGSSLLHGLSLVAGSGLLIAVASLVAEHRL